MRYRNILLIFSLLLAVSCSKEKWERDPMSSVKIMFSNLSDSMVFLDDVPVQPGVTLLAASFEWSCDAPSYPLYVDKNFSPYLMALGVKVWRYEDSSYEFRDRTVEVRNALGDVLARWSFDSSVRECEGIFDAGNCSYEISADNRRKRRHTEYIYTYIWE